MKATAYQFRVFPGVGVSLMSRVLGPAAALLLQADVDTIDYTVHEDGVQTESGTLSKTVVVFDTLQKDARWDKDTTGYNFRWDIPGAFLPNPEKVYSVQITINPAGGAQPFKLAYEPHTEKWE